MTIVHEPLMNELAQALRKRMEDATERLATIRADRLEARDSREERLDGVV